MERCTNWEKMLVFVGGLWIQAWEATSQPSPLARCPLKTETQNSPTLEVPSPSPWVFPLPGPPSPGPRPRAQGLESPPARRRPGAWARCLSQAPLAEPRSESPASPRPGRPRRQSPGWVARPGHAGRAPPRWLSPACSAGVQPRPHWPWLGRWRGVARPLYLLLNPFLAPVNTPPSSISHCIFHIAGFKFLVLFTYYSLKSIIVSIFF